MRVAVLALLPHQPVARLSRAVAIDDIHRCDILVDHSSFHESVVVHGGGLVPDNTFFGFADQALTELDANAPGLLRQFVRFSSLRRHAALLVLAHVEGTVLAQRDLGHLSELGEVIRDRRAREVLRYYLEEDAPKGLIAALRRFHADPAAPASAYVQLLRFYSASDGAVAQALDGLTNFDEQTLRVVVALQPNLVHAAVLKHVRTPAEAYRLNRTTRLLSQVCTSFNAPDFVVALGKMNSAAALPRLLARYLGKADRFPPQPYQGDAELWPLVRAEEFVSLGRTFGNCLRSRLPMALSGAYAYARLRTIAAEAICEFRPLKHRAGWLLWDVYVAGNADVPAHVRDAAEQKCRSVGVLSVHRDWGAGDWRQIQRIWAPSPLDLVA